MARREWWRVGSVRWQARSGSMVPLLPRCFHFYDGGHVGALAWDAAVQTWVGLGRHEWMTIFRRLVHVWFLTVLFAAAFLTQLTVTWIRPWPVLGVMPPVPLFTECSHTN